jgi:pSer/pThr/pTyr-binding forkhead associated (FHA) protein
VFCPECGFKNDEGADYCARCGASLLSTAEDAQTTVSYPPPGDDDRGEAAEARTVTAATLVIRSGGGRAGEVYPFDVERLTIGRHTEANVFLDDVTVSRHHAVIEHEGDQYVIVDEGSLNGTYVNRRRSDRQVLVDGDEIQVGKYKLTFLVP